MSLAIETGTENEILRKKSEPIDGIDKKILKLIKEMGIAMKKKKGVGLAAPQVGINKRLILVTLDNKIVVPMINPKITSHSDMTELGEEGCLSLPGQWGDIKRYCEITVEYLNEKSNKKILKLDSFNSRVVQHEIDHLDGILFTDYLDEEGSIFNVMSQEGVERL